jgi:hypothetical protein
MTTLPLLIRCQAGPTTSSPLGNQRRDEMFGGAAPTVNEEASVRIPAEMYLKQRLVEI